MNKAVIQELNSKFKEFLTLGSTYISAIGKGDKNLSPTQQPVVKTARDLICNKIPEELSKLFDDAIYRCEGSIGQGRIANTPWIAVRIKDMYDNRKDSRIKASIVFFMSTKIDKVFVTLDLRASNFKNSGKKQIASIRQFSIDAAKAVSISNNYFIENKELDIINESYKTGAVYAAEWDLNDTEKDISILQSLIEAYGKFDEIQKSERPIVPDYEKTVFEEEPQDQLLSPEEMKEKFIQFCQHDLAESTAQNYATRLVTNPVIQYAQKKVTKETDVYNINSWDVANQIYEKCVEYNADMRDNGEYVDDLSGKDIKDAPSVVKKYCDFIEYLNNGEVFMNANEVDVLFTKKERYNQKVFSINSLISTIKSTQLIYDDILIKRFAYSLLTKPFVILSGLAGSGKTQLALAFAKAMVEDEKKQMKIISVGADWTNREPLLGFPNALQCEQYVRPENGVLDLLIESNKEENAKKPFFLILDEMNLSYVERYFADFLSAMESHQEIPLWKKPNASKDDTPNGIMLPKNLFIIGTINVDETTYMFSPKVLDRANVIEFKVSEGDMDKFLTQAPQVDMKLCEGKSADMAEDFVNIAKGKKEISTEANEVLKKFFKELKTVNAEFGYRTATEIGQFISLAKDSMDIKEAIDAAIVQKLLPKLHGSRKKIIDVLKPLWTSCGCNPIDTIEEKDLAEAARKATYPLSADKILRMYKSAIDNGFTSFAEA